MVVMDVVVLLLLLEFGSLAGFSNYDYCYRTLHMVLR